MAILENVETSYGENKEIYIRLNNVEVSNHGEHAFAIFRGFFNKEAFLNGKSFIYEKHVKFTPNVSEPMWEQAYKALCEQEGFDEVEV